MSVNLLRLSFLSLAVTFSLLSFLLFSTIYISFCVIPRYSSFAKSANFVVMKVERIVYDVRSKLYTFFGANFVLNVCIF